MELHRRSNARSLNHKAALLSWVIHPSSGDNNACPLLFGLTSRVHHKFISRWNWWMSRPLCSDLAWPLRTRLCCQPLHLYININWIDLRAATRDKVLLKHSMAERGAGDIPGEREILLIVVWGRGRDRMGTPPQIVHFVSWAEMAERNLSGTVRWFRISQTAGHPATADGWGRWEVIRDPLSAIMRKFYGSAPVVSEISHRMTTGRR